MQRSKPKLSMVGGLEIVLRSTTRVALLNAGFTIYGFNVLRRQNPALSFASYALTSSVEELLDDPPAIVNYRYPPLVATNPTGK